MSFIILHFLLFCHLFYVCETHAQEDIELHFGQLKNEYAIDEKVMAKYAYVLENFEQCKNRQKR